MTLPQKNKLPRVQIVTMGCSKNRVDTEHILSQLQGAGIPICAETESVYDGNIDILLINTCGFIKDAKEESIEAILEGIEAKKKGLISKLFVFGCLSQRYRSQLPQELPEVDSFFGAFDVNNILSALGVNRDDALDNRRMLTTPSHYAYLKISEGCNRKCSYCAIPSIRGPHVSIPIEELVDEAISLSEAGVRELILIAQDTTYYGIDIYHRRRLGKLLEKLIEIKGLEWIRIHYSYPDSFPEDVLDIMASSDKMCKYMDIPLQHSSDVVLKAMRRGVDGKATRELVEKMRKRVPGIVLRTTLIVGHPGEGKSEFNDLLSFVKEYRFERLGAFTYSEEEGTYGARHLRDTVSEKVKQSRYERLMELQSQISLEYNLSRIGTTQRVLIDKYCPEDAMLVGRTSKESPQVDGEVLIDASHLKTPSALVGHFSDVEITSADEYDLSARLV